MIEIKIRSFLKIYIYIYLKSHFNIIIIVKKN